MINLDNTNAQTCRHAAHEFAVGCVRLKEVLSSLRARLQQQYEDRFPGRTQTIRRALVRAEQEAWDTEFPHLLLPDLAEARLQPLLATARVPRRRLEPALPA